MDSVHRWLKVVVLAAGVVLSSAACAQVRVGDVPPDSLGVTADGRAVHVSDHAGKVVVTTFWASWCGPCRHELPLLEGLQRAAGPEQLRVVAINIEDGDDFRRVARALSELKLTITHDTDRKSSRAFGTNGIPHMLIIGRDGRVRKIHRGYSEDQIDAYLDEINAALAEPRN